MGGGGRKRSRRVRKWGEGEGVEGAMGSGMFREEEGTWGKGRGKGVEEEEGMRREGKNDNHIWLR